MDYIRRDDIEIIYIYTSLLKIYTAKLIISGTRYNRGATKHRSNLDIIRKLPLS